jgi:hypothetical protein
MYFVLRPRSVVHRALMPEKMVLASKLDYSVHHTLSLGTFSYTHLSDATMGGFVSDMPGVHRDGQVELVCTGCSKSSFPLEVLKTVRQITCEVYIGLTLRSGIR